MWSSTKAAIMITISGCSFENNTSNHAGAIYSDRSNCEFSVKNCNFTSNAATISGGALFVNDTTFQISNSHFSQNKAPVAGAIFFKGEQMLHIKQSTISRTNCETTLFRYLCYAIIGDMSATVILAHVTVCNNEIGGGLNLIQARAEVSHSFFLNNSGSGGGAIYATSQSSPLIIRNTTFVGNRGLTGSALSLSNPVTLMENCTFVGVVSLMSSKVTPLIYVQPENSTDVRIVSSFFAVPKATLSQTKIVQTVLYFKGPEMQIIPITLYVWNTVYKRINQGATQVIDNLTNSVSVHFVNVGSNVNFTSEVSLFASGKSDHL